MDLIFKYSTVFFLAVVKFMIAPATGFGLNLSFWEVFISASLGGMFGFLVFFNASGYFMVRANKKKLEKSKDPNHKPARVHTKMNKTLVKIKHSRFGYWILILLTPSFISIPLGSILIAKFYRHKKGTWVRMLFAVMLFAFIYSYFSDILIAWLK